MWTKEITDGRPPRSERMTGLAREQVADLVTEVSARVGVWQRPVGRPRAMGLYRAVVLTLFLLRHNNSQDVAGELFGCSQATISRLFTLLYPLLGAVNADLVAQVKAEAANVPLLVDGFVAPTGERPNAEANMFCDKHHECGFNVQVVADTGGRLVDVGDPAPAMTRTPSTPPASPSVGPATCSPTARHCWATRGIRAPDRTPRIRSRPAGN